MCLHWCVVSCSRARPYLRDRPNYLHLSRPTLLWLMCLHWCGLLQSSTRKGSEDLDTSPLLPVNNCKQQRASDELKLRVLRWDFTTPRQEFITQLKDQMTNAGMNRTLITNMFHKDFNFHKKSIDALNDVCILCRFILRPSKKFEFVLDWNSTVWGSDNCLWSLIFYLTFLAMWIIYFLSIQDIVENLEACICNLDMILRWISLRFFDTNPSVIIKAMDYLQCLFTNLAEDSYSLMDFEAYSFLPFLVQKVRRWDLVKQVLGVAEVNFNLFV